MITSKDFDKISYQKPRLKDPSPVISKIIGIDSEAYTTGEPFIIGTSENDILDPHSIPECFFTPKYSGSNFVVWNLKYDSGAFLYFLPHEVMYSLWEFGKASYNSFRFKYVPHKMLRIYHRKEKVTFWEISQFFRSSLDKAAKTYLNDQKIRVHTKNFTPKYYRRFKKATDKYCIYDAVLTKRLGEYLIKKLGQFGITASSLYSSASISFKYFCTHANVVTSWRYWNDDKDVLKLACDAYEGGKFEVTARGPFQGAEYDITSAYPYEIANLVNINNAKVTYTPEYQPKAVYGFLDVIIQHNNPQIHLPCGPMPDGVRLYPLGTYRLTITKNEYDYLRSLKVPVTVKNACWLFVKRKIYPYRKTVDALFKIKSDMKAKDKMLYNITKVCLNGFYGKMAQSIPQPDGNVIVGSGWNPIYASVITANTRIKVTKIQNLMRDACIAVHTDSVMVTRPLPRSINLDGALGNFEHVVDGHGIMIACGMYQLNDLCAFKGFRAKSGETWRTILSRFPNRKSIPYSSVQVESWVEAMAKNHPTSNVNVFRRVPKKMQLNCDTKRLWPSQVKSAHLLTTYQKSDPKIHIENI